MTSLQCYLWLSLEITAEVSNIFKGKQDLDLVFYFVLLSWIIVGIRTHKDTSAQRREMAYFHAAERLIICAEQKPAYLFQYLAVTYFSI